MFSIFTKVILACFFFSFSFANDPTSRMEQLEELYQKGLISQHEYVNTRKQILDSLLTPAQNQITNPAADIPGGNLIAVIPFYGKVYADGERDTIAKFTVENCRNYIEKKGYNLNGGILDYHFAKNFLFHEMRMLDPGEAYSMGFLKKAAQILKVRYLFFGNILHYSYDNSIYRFNVDCLVYDAQTNQIIFERKARQSEARKLFAGYVRREKGKTIGKITEQFYFFLDSIAQKK